MRYNESMIQVLIVDDHAIVREGLKQILSSDNGIVVAGEAGNAQEAMTRVQERNWDVVVLDITLPDRNGLEVLKDIKHVRPQLPVLILTMHAGEQYAARALKAGAAGYLNKESIPEQLIQAIQKVVKGGRYITPELAEMLLMDLDRDASKRPHDHLSDREFQILRLIGAGKTLTEIADELCLSVKTVSTYRARVLEKMALKNNAELIRYAIEHQLA